MFMGIDLKWQCLECGHINDQNIGGCNLYEFDGGIYDVNADQQYIGTYCSKCHTEHLVTNAPRCNYIRSDGLVNNYYHKAVVTMEYAKQHNLKDVGACFY